MRSEWHSGSTDEEPCESHRPADNEPCRCASYARAHARLDLCRDAHRRTGRGRRRAHRESRRDPLADRARCAKDASGGENAGRRSLRLEGCRQERWHEAAKLFALLDEFYPVPAGRRWREVPFIPYLNFAPSAWSLSLDYAGGGIDRSLRTSPSIPPGTSRLPTTGTGRMKASRKCPQRPCRPALAATARWSSSDWPSRCERR